MTRNADRRKSTAMAEPMTMSGQDESMTATSTAATNTPRLEITSLREHSKVLDMFTSTQRKRHSRRRQTPRVSLAINPPAKERASNPPRRRLKPLRQKGAKGRAKPLVSPRPHRVPASRHPDSLALSNNKASP